MDEDPTVLIKICELHQEEARHTNEIDVRDGASDEQEWTAGLRIGNSRPLDNQKIKYEF